MAVSVAMALNGQKVTYPGSIQLICLVVKLQLALLQLLQLFDLNSARSPVAVKVVLNTETCLTILFLLSLFKYNDNNIMGATQQQRMEVNFTLPISNNIICIRRLHHPRHPRCRNPRRQLEF